MWLPTIISLSLVLVVSPTKAAGFDAKSASQPDSPTHQRPFSLDDCVNDLSANPQVRWKAAYDACSLFLLRNKEAIVGSGSDNDQSKNPEDDTDDVAALTEDARHPGMPLRLEDLPMYLPKPPQDGEVAGSLGNEGENNPHNSGIRLGMEKDFNMNHISKIPMAGWLRPFHKRGRAAIFRARRQHSLSINSALVSLADMLMAKDYSREQARQRAFRQQLLGLGRR